MSKRLHNELLQSAINGTTERRDKALRDVIRYQGKLDVLKRKQARLLRQYQREAKARLAKMPLTGNAALKFIREGA